MQAVILAGGFGKRLKPLTDERPKPMIEVLGVPILEWQINWLRQHDISDIILSVGYLRETIKNHFAEGRRHGVNIRYSVEEEPLGTGGALKAVKPLIRGDRFISIYGDILTNLNPNLLVKALSESDVGAVAIIPLRSPFGIVEVKNGFVQSFREKPILHDHWMNAGVYCFSSEIFDMLPKKGSLESLTLTSLGGKEKMRAAEYRDVLWRSIDSHKDIEEAEREFRHLVPEVSSLR